MNAVSRIALVAFVMMGGPLPGGDRSETMNKPFLANDAHPDQALATKLNTISGDSIYGVVSYLWFPEQGGTATLNYRGEEADMVQMGAAFRALGLRVGTIVPHEKLPANTWRLMCRAKNTRLITLAVANGQIEKRLQAAIDASPVPTTFLEINAASFVGDMVRVTIKNTTDKTFYVYGEGPDNSFVGLRYRDAESGNWHAARIGYCGTGAGYCAIKPGGSFSGSARMPKGNTSKRVIVEFVRYAGAERSELFVEQTSEIQRTDL